MAHLDALPPVHRLQQRHGRHVPAHVPYVSPLFSLGRYLPSPHRTNPPTELWLKSQGYSISAINVYPTFASVIGVVFTLGYAWASDTVCRGARWPPILFAATTQIIGQASLAAWDLPAGWKWFCFLSMGMAGGTGGMAYAWAHEITSADSEERAIVTAAMNELASVFQAWLPLLVWKVTEAPRYTKGFVTMAGFWGAVVVVTLAIRWLQKRELRGKVGGGGVGV